MNKNPLLGKLYDNNSMSAELLPLPNLNSKIIRSNIENTPEYILLPFFNSNTGKTCGLKDFLINQKIPPLDSEETDILIIIFHLYLTERKLDNLLYFNTDDILILRGIKKNKALKNGFSGYKKEVRKRIDEKIKNLANHKIFTIADYKDFNFVLCFNDKYIENIAFTGAISQKLLSLNPVSKSWHKAIGIFLSELKSNTKTNINSIQIKKLLNTVNTGKLFPFQIRNRLETTLDELFQMNIIKGWQYKNIDENKLNSKNWLFFWQQLSIKIFL